MVFSMDSVNMNGVKENVTFYDLIQVKLFIFVITSYFVPVLYDLFSNLARKYKILVIL